VRISEQGCVVLTNLCLIIDCLHLSGSNLASTSFHYQSENASPIIRWTAISKIHFVPGRPKLKRHQRCQGRQNKFLCEYSPDSDDRVLTRRIAKIFNFSLSNWLRCKNVSSLSIKYVDKILSPYVNSHH